MSRHLRYVARVYLLPPHAEVASPLGIAQQCVHCKEEQSAARRNRSIPAEQAGLAAQVRRGSGLPSIDLRVRQRRTRGCGSLCDTADVKGTHVNQASIYTRPQGRGPLRLLFTAIALFSATLVSNTVQASGTITISGTPVGTVKAGSAYSFTPTVKDSLTGRKLAFNIVGKPSWATFSGSTGKLSGTPSSANVGKFSDIEIAVNDGINAAVGSVFSITVQAAGGTPPPATVKISGTPVTSVTAGSAYHFQPAATDSAGKTISFSVQNKPSWATFSIASGLLSGTPTSAQTGSYANIVVSASDGQASSSLAPFSIAVTGTPVAATGSATLFWTDPSHNTDGTPLNNFAGIRIYYGTSVSSLTHVVQVAGSTAVSYTISNLAAGTWYFGATAYTSAGTESGLSKIGSKSF